jgi:hypothetical protein
MPVHTVPYIAMRGRYEDVSDGADERRVTHGGKRQQEEGAMQETKNKIWRENPNDAHESAFGKDAP